MSPDYLAMLRGGPLPGPFVPIFNNATFCHETAARVYNRVRSKMAMGSTDIITYGASITMSQLANGNVVRCPGRSQVPTHVLRLVCLVWDAYKYATVTMGSGPKEPWTVEITEDQACPLSWFDPEHLLVGRLRGEPPKTGYTMTKSEQEDVAERAEEAKPMGWRRLLQSAVTAGLAEARCNEKLMQVWVLCVCEFDLIFRSTFRLLDQMF